VYDAVHRMKVVFSALHFASFRNFESVVEALAERGHHVHLTADEPERFGGQALVERLAARYPTVTWGFTASPDEEPWFVFAQKVRFAINYVRYLAPRYDEVPKLRMRTIERAPRIVRWLSSGRVGHRRLLSGLLWLERMLPRSEVIDRSLADQRPDVLLLAQLTVARSLQMEQLKAAKVLGIPVAACIMSWDHLSSKTLLYVPPDLTIVWNDVQKHEAVDLHGLPEDRIAITGAQCYDQWFDRKPSRTREEFCRAVGLDPSRRFVLYACSAMSPTPDPPEPMFVKEWVGAIRASAEARLKEASILVRPHPEKMREWTGVSLDVFDHVVVHGRTPIDSDAKADYFDAIYYCDAVVGLNTSVFVEAAIVGRPVLALVLPPYRLHQDQMAHFRYLTTVAGGLLVTAPDLRSHLAQLARVIGGSRERDEQNRRFVRAFVRPNGLETAATPAFVEAVERLAAEGRRAPDPALTRRTTAHAWIATLAAASRGGVLRWLLMDSEDIAAAVFERGRDADKQRVLDRRADQWEQERQARGDRLEAKAQLRREKATRRATEQRARTWRRWRSALSPRKQVARLKGGVKQLIGSRQD
jgi:hypothetical protein